MTMTTPKTFPWRLARRRAGLSHATAIDGVTNAGERAHLQFANRVRHRGNSVGCGTGQFAHASSVFYSIAAHQQNRNMIIKILVIGATGAVGKAVVNELAQRHEVIQASRSSVTYPVDITQAASIEALFKKTGKIDAIVATVGSVQIGRASCRERV